MSTWITRWAGSARPHRPPAPGRWGRFVFNKIPSQAIILEADMQTIKERIAAAKKEKQRKKDLAKDLAEKFKKKEKQ